MRRTRNHGCVHTRRGDELTAARRALPWVPVDKEYRFDTGAGARTLAELFEGRSQLLVYHFMLGPEYEAGCPSCSAIADGFQGFRPHMAARDVTMTAISRAPLAKLQAYKERMGWSFPWASSFGSDFNYDLGATTTTSATTRAARRTPTAQASPPRRRAPARTWRTSSRRRRG